MTAKTSKIKLTPEKIVQATLKLAGEQSWEHISLYDIASDLDVSLSDIFDVVEDKQDILGFYGRHIDKQVLAQMGQFGDGDSKKDILFDVLMDRFEILNENRAALLSILKSFKFDPKQALFSAPHLCKSISWMCEAANVNTFGWRGAMKITAITGIYLNALRVWMRDETQDLSKTMAVLDKSLNQVTGYLKL